MLRCVQGDRVLCADQRSILASTLREVLHGEEIPFLPQIEAAVAALHCSAHLPSSGECLARLGALGSSMYIHQEDDAARRSGTVAPSSSMGQTSWMPCCQF